jgi:hypothetical protein
MRCLKVKGWEEKKIVTERAEHPVGRKKYQYGPTTSTTGKLKVKLIF